jgi:PAS domain S-box-containing protein
LRQQAHRLLSGLNRTTDVAVLIADDHARYLAANPSACAMTGFSETELLKMTVWQLSAPSQRRSAERQWRLFLTDGMTVGLYQLRRKDGAILPVHYAAATHVLPGIHVSVLALRPVAGAKRPASARDRRVGSRRTGKTR